MQQQEQSVGLSELLQAGVHFGHQTRRWNPKMRKFIFTERNGIHIIDLRKTLDRLEAAKRALRRIVTGGGKVLSVCTKTQLRAIIEEEAERAGAFYVTERWLGGMLTNFQTIRKQIRRLKELERGQEEGAFEFYTKKEQLLLDRERLKLEKYFSGVKEMGRLPGAVFVVDARREIIAVREAHRLGIPVVAITDTNADPDYIDHPIPGNDDAIRSVSLITREIANTILEASREVPEDERRKIEEAEATTYSTETGEAAAAASQERPDRPTRKPRRRRRPRPEVIAKLQKSDTAEDELEEAQEVAEEVAPDEEGKPGTEASAEEAPAGEGTAEAATGEAEAAEEDGSAATARARGPQPPSTAESVSEAEAEGAKRAPRVESPRPAGETGDEAADADASAEEDDGGDTDEEQA